MARGVSSAERRSRESRPFPQIGVRTDPGSISTTPMPAEASSTRSASATARSANFDALYGAMNGTAKRPEIDPTNSSLPREARSCGRNAWLTATGPKRLISNCRRNSSTGKNSSGPATATPALFTTPRSGRPLAATVRAAASIAARSVTSSSTGRTFGCNDAVRAASASRRTPANVTNPSRANSSTAAAPIPLDAPVTTTAPRPSPPFIPAVPARRARRGSAGAGRARRRTPHR